MDKKTVNPKFIFFLVLLVAIGIFLLYSRLTFTGYVTNVANATTGVLLSSHSFDTGDFSNTAVDSEGSVVLMPTKTAGTYTSQVFDGGREVLWTGFVPVYVMHSSSNYSEDPLNSSIIFSVRACNDSICTGRDFVAYSDGISLLGQYFQYKAVMQILSGNESPEFSEVNVSHYPPNILVIDIVSPQNVTYYNESVRVKISSNPGATVWFYNGTDNELYTSEFNRTFSEGTHVMNVFVNYIDGTINYTKSSSLAFTVGFLHTYYRLSNNACSAVTLTNVQKTANDYNTVTECESHITDTTSTTSTTSEANSQSCSPNWECSWGECIDGVQTEECIDTSTCTTVAEPPAVRTQACTGGIVTTTAATTSAEPEITTTTEPETTKKGFFSFVGSAIVGPIFKSTVGVIFIILLVLVIGGFFAYKFLLKGNLKLKLDFFKRKKKPFFFNR